MLTSSRLSIVLRKGNIALLPSTVLIFLCIAVPVVQEEVDLSYESNFWLKKSKLNDAPKEDIS
jgi:hypothetical protein